MSNPLFVQNIVVDSLSDVHVLPDMCKCSCNLATRILLRVSKLSWEFFTSHYFLVMKKTLIFAPSRVSPLLSSLHLDMV